MACIFARNFRILRSTNFVRRFSESQPGKILPVSILSGHLGAGKTTLLNGLIRNCEKQGSKVAVVQNEFGEIALDDELVASKFEGENENIQVTNSGCLCCTVRGDLLEIFQTKLLPRFQDIDHVFIETTGLAMPGPVVQSFFMHPTMQQWTKLDGIITVVGAPNFTFFTSNENVKKETVEQIAFADRLILSKIDLLSHAEVQDVKNELGSMNPSAPIIEALNGDVQLDDLVGIDAFELERVEAMLEKEKSLHGHGHSHSHGHNHSHAISSAGIEISGNMDERKLSQFLGTLLQTKGEQIFRSKAIISVAGQSHKLVFQSVHMTHQGGYTDAWKPEEERRSRFVFIGTDIDKEFLTRLLKKCVHT